MYTQKLQFLHQVWPTEYIEHLAPRAALLVEGAAFQKLARLDAQKLRSADGVKILIETLGGAWGRTDPEDTYDLFERALYSVSQRSDETNDSYLARHDTVFEDLLSKKITLADVRAYVLVRQSNLSSDDRKRIIVDNQGQLTYEQARKSLRLLGSRFFQDLQGNRANHGKKTYEAYQLDEPEDNHQAAFMQETESMEIDEEQIFQLLADQGDEDAVFISDFEDQIVDAIQDHPGLSQCFLSYQEARARVRERARARGFWPVKGKTKGKEARRENRHGHQPMDRRGLQVDVVLWRTGLPTPHAGPVDSPGTGRGSAQTVRMSKRMKPPTSLRRSTLAPMTSPPTSSRWYPNSQKMQSLGARHGMKVKTHVMRLGTVRIVLFVLRVTCQTWFNIRSMPG